MDAYFAPWLSSVFWLLDAPFGGSQWPPVSVWPCTGSQSSQGALASLGSPTPCRGMEIWCFSRRSFSMHFQCRRLARDGSPSSPKIGCRPCHPRSTRQRCRTFSQAALTSVASLCGMGAVALSAASCSAAARRALAFSYAASGASHPSNRDRGPPCKAYCCIFRRRIHQVLLCTPESLSYVCSAAARARVFLLAAPLHLHSRRTVPMIVSSRHTTRLPTKALHAYGMIHVLGGGNLDYGSPSVRSQIRCVRRWISSEMIRLWVDRGVTRPALVAIWAPESVRRIPCARIRILWGGMGLPARCSDPPRPTMDFLGNQKAVGR